MRAALECATRTAPAATGLPSPLNSKGGAAQLLRRPHVWHTHEQLTSLGAQELPERWLSPSPVVCEGHQQQCTALPAHSCMHGVPCTHIHPSLLTLLTLLCCCFCLSCHPSTLPPSLTCSWRTPVRRSCRSCTQQAAEARVAAVATTTTSGTMTSCDFECL